MIKEINNLDLINEIYSNLFDQKLSTNLYSKCIIYELNNKIVGFCIYDLIYDRCEIEYIGVLEEYRNKKIASKLLEYIIDYSINNNIKNISLEVSLDNTSAINLYKKFEFKDVSIRKNYYDNKDAYLMVREF